MPSAHTPEWSKIRTLKAKLQSGRATASGGRVGRELTEEELEDCREKLAQLEQKRDQGIEDRRVAKETHDNTEKLLGGQQDILQAINGVNSRLDTVIAPTGSSAHHRLLAKEVAKRERDLEKVRRRLQQGIVPAEGDFYVGTVLVKADALDQLEELRDRNLEAEFSLTGLPCRLVQISGQDGIVHLLAPDLAVLKSKRHDMAFYNMRLQAFHKDLFYETVAWKAGLGPPVLLDGDDKKLPKNACLRLVVPNIVRIALAKLPAVEVLEERPAKRRAVEPAPGKPQAPATKDLWEVVEEGSTTAPSTEEPTEPEPTQPEPIEELAPEKAPEPEPLSEEAQHLLSSGKEVWAATVSQRMVLFERLRNHGTGVPPDMVAKLINLQDTDTVDAWHKNSALPRILNREEEGEIYVTGAFLQAHCKKLSLEVSPSQRERSRTPPRRSAPLGRGVGVRPLPAKAEDVHMADEEVDDKPAAEQEPDKRPELSDQDRAQVESIINSGKVVWAAAKESDRAVLFQQLRRRPSAFQPAPELDVELINPERDEELVVCVWCKGRFPKITSSRREGQFCLHPEFVHAYCWELSLDNVKPAEGVPAPVAEDEAEPAPVADANLAVAEDKPQEPEDAPEHKEAEDKPAELRQDLAEEAADAEDAKMAELHQEPEQADDQPAEAEAEPAEPAAPEAEDGVMTLHGLKVRELEGGWYELMARTMDEFEAAEKILREKLKDKTFAEFKMKRADKGFTSEMFEVRWDTGKLWLPKGRRSVVPEEAKAKVRLTA